MKKPKLFFLHFAGGNSYSFQFLYPYLKKFEIHALELPGRGKRIAQPLIKDMDAAIDDYYNQINPLITAGCDFIIYGHSMGASLGLGLVKKLESINKIPVSLIVSGNAGPRHSEQKSQRYLMPVPEFKDELRRLGGVPEEVLQHSELFSFFEPVLRADFCIVETKEVKIETPVKTPIYAMMGNREEQAQTIENWKTYTEKEFAHRIFSGGHFFIHDHAAEIAQIIINCYDKNLVL